MSDSDKKKKQKELKLKEPTEITAEIGYVQEQAVKNISEDIVKFSSDDGEEYNETKKIHLNYKNGDKYECLELKNVKFNVEYKDDAQCLLLFSLEKMRAKIANGATLDDVFNDMKDFILANKDSNPDLVQRAIAQLLGKAENHYDEGRDNILGISGFTRHHQGDSAEEILGKILNIQQDEELDGFVCSTIHEFGKRLLDECGIEATMLAGGTRGTNHTCLLWKRSDGKYIMTNYGTSYTLNANNIKDAAKEVYKKGLGLKNNGYSYYIDNNGSHQESLMKEVAAFGNELDKRDYNNQSVFDHSIARQPLIHGSATVSNIGSMSAEVSRTIAYGNETVSKEITYSIDYEKHGKTSVADHSTSVGFKLDHKSERILEKGKKYSETKVVVDYTRLSTDSSFADNNYYMALTGNRTYADPEQVEKLREWYGKEYERENTIEQLEQKVRFCNSYLEHFEQDSQYQDRPDITKEDYINNFLSTYTDGDGVAYNDLNEYGKSNAMWVAEQRWIDYLINHRYEEGREIILQRLADYKDHIENYDEYREKYIQQELESLSKFGIGTPDSKQELQSFDTSHLTVFLRRVFGKEKTLLKDKGVELTNGWQLSGVLGFNDVLTCSKHHITENRENGKLVSIDDNVKQEPVFSSFGGDFRLAAEDGMKINIKNGTSLFSTAVSGGITTDFSLKSGTLTPSLTPGVKLNGSANFRTKIGDNVIFRAGLDGYSVVNRVSIDSGARGSLQAAYTPNGKSVTIFGSISTEAERQRIRIGGFNELTEKVNSIIVSLGAQLGAKGSISINYNNRADLLNSTRNRAIYSVKANINL